MLPACIELILERRGKIPEGDAARRIEDLPAAMGCDGEDRSGRRESVSAGETPGQREGSQRAELAIRVPPACKVQLAEAGDDQPELEELVEVRRHVVASRV